MNEKNRSAGRCRVVGAAVALALIGGAVIGDGPTAVPAHAAAHDGMPATTNAKYQAAKRAMKAKSYGFFRTHGAGLTPSDFTNPQKGGYVYNQYIGSEGAPPVAIGYRKISVGSVENITPQTTTFVEATAREAKGVVLKNKTVWTKVKNRWTKLKRSLWGEGATPELKTELAVQSRRSSDSSDAQSGTYRRYSTVDDEAVLVVSTWRGESLVNVELEDPDPRPDGQTLRGQSLIGKPGKQGTRMAFFIPATPSGAPDDPVYLSNPPKNKQAFGGKDFAVVVTRTNDVGTRFVDLWENHPEGPKLLVQGYKLPSKAWANQHMSAAKNRLMTQAAGRKVIDYGLDAPLKVYRANYDVYTMEILVKELGNGAEIALTDPWIAGGTGPLGAPRS